MDDIVNLPQLLGLKSNQKITERKIKCLTAPGENYGSLMLSVDLKIQSTEDVHIVAKTLPPNPEMQEMFNCPVTFRNEIALYKTILPVLRNFLREKKVTRSANFAAEYYGSRPNLHGNDSDIDKDAVLLLENLKVKGFVNLERTVGFDLEGAKLVLDDLAHLHAIPIGLKLQKPEVFDREIKPFLTPFSLPKEVLNDLEEKYLKIINSVPQLQPHLERLKRVNMNVYPPPLPREPFATISHNDCWVNNTMVRLENGTPVENKIVDFQICDYGSPARDVLFFLFSSVQNKILEENFDSLVKYYYGTFASILGDLGCDLEPFSFSAFLKEIDVEAKSTQFVHVALMLFPIFAPKLEVSDMADVKPTDIGNVKPTDLHKEKLVFVVEQFVKRNWL